MLKLKADPNYIRRRSTCRRFRHKQRAVKPKMKWWCFLIEEEESEFEEEKDIEKEEKDTKDSKDNSAEKDS